MGYDSSIKNNEILPSATTQMDLACIVLSAVSHTEIDKFQMIPHMCGI